ncbi:MAG TPA: class I SAM-dependent methyltransferase [Myxococcota bacterium]|nr:class I SAM-dependent methyltransferase [Myxococcota bacterium]
MDSLLAVTGVALAAALLLSLAHASLRWGVVPMPTGRRARHLCVALLEAELAGRDGTVADVGAGLGVMAASMRRAAPRTQVWAIEGSLVICTLGRMLTAVHGRLTGRARAPIAWSRADFMTCDLSACVGVFCYLYPGGMPALADKLRRELRPGAFVISNTFALPGWEPTRVLHTGGLYSSPMYLYHVRR